MITMRNLTIAIILILLAAQAQAGSLDSPAAVDAAASRMYTLEQAYQKAASGTDPTKASGTFVKPATGATAGTMHTIDQIVAKIVAGTTTAAAADVDTGKTFITRTGSDSGEAKVTGTGHIVTGTGTGSAAAAAQITTGYYAWGSTGAVIQGSASASAYGIPKTGQTTSYATGDDGASQKGTPSSGNKYTDNGNNTITDNGTGLMWIKDHNAIGTVGGYNFASTFTWANALLAVAALNSNSYAGYTDWRLPNVKELQSIVNYGNWSPAIGESTVGGSGTGAPFTNTQSNNYWSSTTYAYNTTLAWYVYFTFGSVSYGAKTNTFYVRPVRGG